MRRFAKSAMLSAALLIGAATAANAELASNRLALPDVSITAPAHRAPTPVPRSWYYDPYTSGRSQHSSSNSTIRVPRAPRPTPMSWIYDPYAGGAGQCASGTQPGSAVKCDQIIPLSHRMR